jgi:excisionase family DNA binding protein
VNGSQVTEMITETDPSSVQPSQPFTGNPKDFTTRLLPTSGGRHAGIQAASPTTADLYAFHGGPGRLRTVSEAAEQLRVGTWAVYRLCETGELPHMRFIDSIRIRPPNLDAFVAARSGTVGRPPRGPTPDT